MKKFMHKSLSIILVMTLVLSLFSGLGFSAYADDLLSSGSCGENVTYTFDSETGTLTISGSGAMFDYLYAYPPFYIFRDDIVHLEVLDGVTSIGSAAFQSCSGLTSVALSDSVTSIGERAFSGCSGLTSIDIKGSNCIIYNSADTLPKNATIIINGSKNVYNYAIKYNRNYICNHIAVVDNAREATCTQSALTTGTHCKACGEILQRQETIAPPLGHLPVDDVWDEPTCTESGYKDILCNRCGELLETDVVVPALGHLAIDEIVEETTCTEKGLKNVKCGRCELLLEEGVEVPARGHTYLQHITAPTCTERGFTTYTCKRCSDTYVSDYLEALGHTLAEAVRENEVAPTCTKDGSYDEAIYCTVCKQEISRQTKAIEKLGHDLKTVETIAPTYTEEGYDILQCQRAGCNYSCQGNVVPPTLASITVSLKKPISLLERADAMRYKRDELAMQQYSEYFYAYDYSIYQQGNAITLTTTNGTKEVFTYREDKGEFVNAAGEYIYPEVKDTQCEATPWTVGTNYFTVSYGDKSVSVPVTIRQNPIVQIAFIPAKEYVYTEHANGFWEEYEDWDEDLNNSTISVYHYNLPSFSTGDMLYVTYNDVRGTVLYTYIDTDMAFVSAAGEQIDANAVERSGNTYGWEVGNQNYFEINYSDSYAEVPVRILDNPVASISFTPVKPYELMENSEENKVSFWNEATDSEEWFCIYSDYTIYQLGNQINVNYKNGSSDTFVCKQSSNELVFTNETGEEIYPEKNDTQYEHPWKRGSDNYFVVTWLGASASVPVTILESPVANISFSPVKPITLFENHGGYFEGECFVYDCPTYNLGDELIVYYKTGTSKKYTVQMKTTQNGSYPEFLDNAGNPTPFSVHINQFDQNEIPWTVNGANYFTISYASVETRVPVTILRGHPYDRKVINPTATNVGYTLYTCSCGETYKDNYTAPTGKQTLKCKTRTATAQTVAWNNVKTATGYQVQISTKDGKKWATSATLKAGVTNYTFKSLAAGNNYKFRVRFYINAPDGKNYFSPWSATLNSPTLPTGTTITKLTPASKAFVAQWKKNATVNGYQVQYSLKANFAGAKTITVKNPKLLKATAAKLYAGKYYFVRIRTYKSIAKANYFSTWSKTYKVKTK